MSSILNYNEKKVSQELPRNSPEDPVKHAADLIHASGFLKDADRLNYHDKTERFTQLNSLRERTQVNMMHISLNFDPSEKDLPKETLIKIADRYMEGIGFKDQPYLVYQHKDAGHPHLHVVTNIIRTDGTRIETNNIGKLLSEPTRKAIEKEFALVPAERSREQKKVFDLKPVDPSKVEYGTTQETKKAMQQVVRHVYQNYKYTSLGEYNAALRQYNVTADPGEKGSRIAQHGGLVYRALENEGKKVGPPIKASSFYFKPTNDHLEEKYKENFTARKEILPSIARRIDWALHQNPDSFREFISSLQKEGIEAVIRQNKDGRVYGMTYVDTRSKTVVNGSDLGKQYSAAGILDRYDLSQSQNHTDTQTASQKQSDSKSYTEKPGERTSPHKQTDTGRSGEQTSPSQPFQRPQSNEPVLPLVHGFNQKVPQVVSMLMRHEDSFGMSPQELSMDARHRRRQRI